MYLKSIWNTLGNGRLTHVTKSVTKTVFWRIGFHMCADRPRKQWRKSSRRRGFGATATATATAKLHIGWFEQTLWKRERMDFGEEKQGLKDVHCLKIPGVYYHFSAAFQILDIFWHFGHWPKSGLSPTQVVSSFHLQQFFLSSSANLNWIDADATCE